MIIALLLSIAAAGSPDCREVATARSAEAATVGVRHAFQNGGGAPLRLDWIDPTGKRVDLGVIAPGGFKSVQTYVGHVFVLTDPAGACRRVVRADDAVAGTYAGTSRYRPVAARAGWRVFVDMALDPAADPARAAIGIVARMLAEAEAALPAAALARVRTTPIFLQAHSGPSGMYHPDPDWLVAHGRTVEMLEGIEISDAEMFLDTSRVQPGAVLHELAHAYEARLPAADRAAIEAAYRHAMASGLYRGVKRHDGSIVDAYARGNASEYFAELSEAWFSRNDFFPFTRGELAAYDPQGAAVVARVWGSLQ